MPNLTIRDTTPEIMDDFSLSATEIDPVLEGLGKVNSWFGGHENIITALKNFSLQNEDTISDWGCGDDDTLIVITNSAKIQPTNLNPIGIDAAATAIPYAKKQSAGFS